jgi:hypothetical protein
VATDAAVADMAPHGHCRGRSEGGGDDPHRHHREAIRAALALGTVAVEPQPNENGERPIWLEERWLDKLNSIRRSGEQLLGGHHQPSDAAGRTLDPQTALRKLRAMRRRGESYSDVILRLATERA